MDVTLKMKGHKFDGSPSNNPSSKEIINIDKNQQVTFAKQFYKDIRLHKKSHGGPSKKDSS